MTIEYTVQLNEQQLELLTSLMEERVYELRHEVDQGHLDKDFWLKQMQHYYSLLKSGKNPLISWNSIIGGAFPAPIQPTRWEEWLSNKHR